MSWPLDLGHNAGAPVAQDHQLLVQLVQQTTNAQTTAVAVQNVQIVDQANGNAVLAFGALKDISAVAINLGNGNNTITIDANSFKNVAAPQINLTGGTGTDNLVFDNAGATQWNLTGKDSGTVTGGGVSASFQAVGNLTGAANNADTLTVKAGGTLSGTFDGGRRRLRLARLRQRDASDRDLPDQRRAIGDDHARRPGL